jgi:hypothetical protein
MATCSLLFFGNYAMVQSQKVLRTQPKKDAAATVAFQDANSQEPRLVRLSINREVIIPEYLSLPAGDYIFEVVNHNVEDYVTFAIATQGADKGIDKILKTSFIRQPIYRGEKSKTGLVNLEPGEYVYYVIEDPDPLQKLVVTENSDSE